MSTPDSEILSIKQKLLDSIHISDLMLCRRKVCFSRLDTPSPIADQKKIKYYMSGEIKHHYLQEILGPEFECEKEIV
jgi:hypothetical protein